MSERRPREEKHEERRPAERSSGGRRAGEGSSGERRAAERNSGERRHTERSSGERRAAERSSGERRAAERSSAERRHTEKNAGGRRSAESRSAERSHLSERERLRIARQVEREKKTKRQHRILIAVLAVLVVCIAAFLVIEVFPVYASAKMEIGTEATADDFVRLPFLKGSFASDSESYDCNKMGTYRIRVKAGMFTHTCMLTITDLVPPDLITQDVITGREGTVKPEDFVVSAEDATSVTYDFAKAPDTGKIGEMQEVMIRATDEAGNVSEKPAHVTILPTTYRLDLEAGSPPPGIEAFIPAGTDNGDSRILTDISTIDYNTMGETDIRILYNGTEYPAKIRILDSVAPVFLSADNFTSFLGESIRYKEHVSVWDNGGAFELQVDTSQVDPNTEGTYPVTYTAKDTSGNEASVMIQLTIARKTADEEVLFAMVDEILASIITEDMSKRDKVEAIYNYVNGSFPFVNWSDKSSYIVAATDMIRNGQGDCYSFFALTKALLTRADIRNGDIAASGFDEHYWNLVDIDDGHGWYHVDTTPNIVPMRVCLWTSADIAAANDGRYIYNPADYPPIP